MKRKALPVEAASLTCREWRERLAILDDKIGKAQQTVSKSKEAMTPLLIATHCDGSDPHRQQLLKLRETVIANQLILVELQQTREQAMSALAVADGALAAAQEAERLAELAALAQKRITIAEQVDAGIGALCDVLAEMFSTQSTMYRLLGTDVRHDHLRRKIAIANRVHVALANSPIAEFVPSLRTPTDVVDPRSGKTFADMERQAMQGLMSRERDDDTDDDEEETTAA
jgi:hypothetical protein